MLNFRIEEKKGPDFDFLEEISPPKAKTSLFKVASLTPPNPTSLPRKGRFPFFRTVHLLSSRISVVSASVPS
jgi:hypothetical protein